MKCFSIEMIEKLVRYPESLDEQTRQAVQAYLDRDPFAAKTAAFYRGFFEQLDADEGAASAGVDPSSVRDDSTISSGPGGHLPE